MNNNNLSAIAVIPARYKSTRFPGKPLALLAGKPVIQHVYEAASSSGLFTEVIVATDDNRIVAAVTKFGGNAVMTASTHQSGTDRVAEACSNISGEIIVNIQGDEPFITSLPLSELLKAFSDKTVNVASLMNHFSEVSEITNPNCVKVVCDCNNNALYFSRSVIPFNQDGSNVATYYRHIGVYAYRREALYNFVQLAPGKIEKLEKLEQLRLLENGIPIRMILTDYSGIGIDTREDLLKAEKLIQQSLLH
ncbi:MAG: 3-deoxy-manno-octulosonate cytidylyltransferase [Candidatus Cloacimonetes bacterium]|nr:3-deoxy-manno-octulosonate cytidylyltransferase [Candidatus Cloacimonadota bacterium]